MASNDFPSIEVTTLADDAIATTSIVGPFRCGSVSPDVAVAAISRDSDGRSNFGRNSMTPPE